jgi:hypothetical protein
MSELRRQRRDLRAGILDMTELFTAINCMAACNLGMRYALTVAKLPERMIMAKRFVFEPFTNYWGEPALSDETEGHTPIILN